VTSSGRYEAPAIVERTPVGRPLVLAVPSGGVSAVFRTEAEYEAPAIVERTPVDLPLIGVLSGGVPSSAVFRTEAEYEAPAIVERTMVDMPLIGTASTVPSAMFRPETIDGDR
jgi:hypothetical protein